MKFIEIFNEENKGKEFKVKYASPYQIFKYENEKLLAMVNDTSNQWDLMTHIPIKTLKSEIEPYVKKFDFAEAYKLTKEGVKVTHDGLEGRVLIIKDGHIGTDFDETRIGEPIWRISQKDIDAEWYKA